MALYIVAPLTYSCIPYLQGKGLDIVDLAMNYCPASVFLVVIVNIFLTENNPSCVWQ